jgi:hypothetical protein
MVRMESSSWRIVESARADLPGTLGPEEIASHWQNYQPRDWKSVSVDRKSRAASRAYDSQSIAEETKGLAPSACLKQGKRSEASSDLST